MGHTQRTRTHGQQTRYGHSISYVMPDDGRGSPIYGTSPNRDLAACGSAGTVAAVPRAQPVFAVARPAHKRQRTTSLVHTPENNCRQYDHRSSSNNVAMEVTTGDNNGACSDGSSDWDDWADAMVAQGQPTEAAVAAAVDDNVGLGPGSAHAEEEAWVRSMIEQGTDASVVQEEDSRAWDYVLEMAVQEADGDGERQGTGEWVSDNWAMFCLSFDELRRILGCWLVFSPGTF